jgi:capsid protein
VRQIGMALELPFEVLTMHFQSSYSAARAALLMAWKMFRSRRDFLATYLCQPVFELWLEDEVAQGRVSCPGFFADPVVKAAWCAAIWTGDGPGSIDPAKEVEAAEKRVNLGISTKQAESILLDGVEWEVKHEQRVKEINAEKRDGIYIAPAGSPAPSGAANSSPKTTPE